MSATSVPYCGVSGSAGVVLQRSAKCMPLADNSENLRCLLPRARSGHRQSEAWRDERRSRDELYPASS
jgi:hypothetical protein